MTEQKFFEDHSCKVEAILRRALLHHNEVDRTMSAVYEAVALLDGVVSGDSLPYAAALLRSAGASIRNIAWSFANDEAEAFHFLTRLAINYLLLAQEILAAQGENKLADSLLRQACGYAHTVPDAGCNLPSQTLEIAPLAWKSFEQPRLLCNWRASIHRFS